MKVIRKPKLDPRLMTQTELIAYVHELETENARLEEANDHLLDKIQSFYKNEKLDLIDRGRFLRELNDEIDENAECRMAVTADELLEFIEEFEPVTEGELVARLSELEEENARLEESFQRATGAVAADALPTFAEMRKVSEMCEKTKCTKCIYFDKKEHHCRFDDGADHWDFGGADDETD